MTIAMCYVSPEGVVMGADSTSSALVQDSTGVTQHHFLNHNQKLFQLGEKASVGVLTWGWAGLSKSSHRTLFAQLADSFSAGPQPPVQDIANAWATQFFTACSADPLVGACKALDAKPSLPSGTPASPAFRTADEEKILANLKANLFVGFCIGGHQGATDRTPQAFTIQFAPTAQAAPQPSPIPVGSYFFAGAPNMIRRLINGADQSLRDAILNSQKWNGTSADLDAVMNQYVLNHPLLPIRDAIDFVHACIYSTIKAMKFSNLSQVCGGPIELAVITTDRPFRWVRHKEWDAAILEWDTASGEGEYA